MNEMRRMWVQRIQRMVRSVALKCAVHLIVSVSDRISMNELEERVIRLAKRFEKYLMMGE